MTLIGVKSKYGSCRGTCMGLINFNNKWVYIFIYTAYFGAFSQELNIVYNPGSNPGMGL